MGDYLAITPPPCPANLWVNERRRGERVGGVLRTLEKNAAAQPPLPLPAFVSASALFGSATASATVD